MKASRILIIDNDISRGDFFEQMFAAEHIQATLVTPTQLSSYTFPPEAFHLILLNMRTFYRDSLQLLDRLSCHFQTSKVIAMVDSVDSDNRKLITTALQEGAYSYVEKHIHPELFLHIVKRALELHFIELEHQHSLIKLAHDQIQLQSLLSRINVLNQELTDTRQILSVMAKNLDRAREDAQKQITSHIKHLIFPLIEEIGKDRSLKECTSKLDTFVNYVEDLDSSSFTDLSEYTSLSPRELRVALMVKYGLTSLEIAEQLHITPATVKTHRRNIRRKLGVRGMKKHLRAFIQTLDHPANGSTQNLDQGVCQTRC